MDAVSESKKEIAKRAYIDLLPRRFELHPNLKNVGFITGYERSEHHLKVASYFYRLLESRGGANIRIEKNKARFDIMNRFDSISYPTRSEYYRKSINILKKHGIIAEEKDSFVVNYINVYSRLGLTDFYIELIKEMAELYFPDCNESYILSHFRITRLLCIHKIGMTYLIDHLMGEGYIMIGHLTGNTINVCSEPLKHRLGIDLYKIKDDIQNRRVKKVYIEEELK